MEDCHDILRMSNPPTPSAPPPAPPSPSPGYPPYPPYPWYPSPPSRDHTALIIVIIVLVVAALIVVPAVLYVMVSGLTSGPEEVDYPALLTPELTNGNATISIGSASPEFSPERLEIVLRANTSLSAVDVPPSDESVLVNMTDYGFRLTWLDHNLDGIV